MREILVIMTHIFTGAAIGAMAGSLILAVGFVVVTYFMGLYCEYRRDNGRL